MKNPIFYALAEKHNEGFYYNFATEEEDHHFPSFDHMLPTKELVETYVEDHLSDGYEIVEVHLVSYKEGVIHVQNKEPDCWTFDWAEEEEEEEEEIQMTTYQIFVNGKNQGTITTDNAESFVKENYPKAKSEVNEEGRHIYLRISIIDAMNIR